MSDSNPSVADAFAENQLKKQKAAKLLLNNSTGDFRNEFENKTRKIPLSVVDDYDLIKQLVPNWMMARKPLVGRGPETAFTYGLPSEDFSIEGAFDPSQPDLIGLQSKTLYESIDANPAALGSIAHELVHYFQRRKSRDKVAQVPNTGWAYGAPDFELSGEADAQRLTRQNFPGIWQSTQDGIHYGESAPANEKEAQIMSRLAENYFQVKRQEELQKKFAPELRPH